MGRASEQSGQARLLFSYKTDLRYSDVDFREYKSFKRIVNMAKYIISIDQSTQGTKALLFDETGSIMRRTDRPHRQIINEKGWVSHDPEEIYSNVLEVVKELLEGVEKEYVVGPVSYTHLTLPTILLV